MTTFGEYVRNLRLERRITLREFCRTAELDPSNWSKIERGRHQPPKTREVLNSIAEALGLGRDSEEFLTLTELAAISHIPTELVDSDVVNRLPIFFRTIRGEKPTREELEEIIKTLRES